jgi:hypothetical protein
MPPQQPPPYRRHPLDQHIPDHRDLDDAGEHAAAVGEAGGLYHGAAEVSFILLVSSELIAARQGLGYLIGALGANGSYEAMFAVVLTVAMLGFIADRVYQAVVARAMRWRQ